jgi:hypothetical protein
LGACFGTTTVKVSGLFVIGRGDLLVHIATPNMCASSRVEQAYVQVVLADGRTT